MRGTFERESCSQDPRHLFFSCIPLLLLSLKFSPINKPEPAMQAKTDNLVLTFFYVNNMIQTQGAKYSVPTTSALHSFLQYNTDEMNLSIHDI